MFEVVSLVDCMEEVPVIATGTRWPTLREWMWLIKNGEPAASHTVIHRVYLYEGWQMHLSKYFPNLLLKSLSQGLR